MALEQRRLAARAHAETSFYGSARSQTSIGVRNNDPDLRQIRAGGIDEHVFRHWRSDHPEVFGKEDFSPLPMTSFPDLQKNAASRLKTNLALQQAALFGAQSRGRRVVESNGDPSRDSLFIGNSDWIKQALNGSMVNGGSQTARFMPVNQQRLADT